MNFRKAILAFSLGAAAIPAAFAANFVGGEAGWASHPVNGPITRQQVQREYEVFRQHPVFFDGTVMIQGEAGYVSANQGVSVDRTPNRPHTHVLGNSGTPVAMAAPLTAAERSAYQQQYVN